MKCFDKVRTIFLMVALFFCVLLIGKAHSAFANSELFVNLKDGKTIYKDEAITTDLFEFCLGNKTICDLENIEMVPNVFTEEGEQFVTFAYKDGDVTYMKKLTVFVNAIAPAFLSGGQESICLVKGQTVTKEHLPEIYLHYNNGEREQIIDYSFQVDWDKKQVCVSYEHLQFCIVIDATENRMDYLEVESKLKSVPENYAFNENDINVTLHYTNGMKENITDYQIMPYKLVEGCESRVYVTYKEMIGSFQVTATKKIIEETPLPTKQPDYSVPEVTLPEPSCIPDIEETFTPEPSAMPEQMPTPLVEYTALPEKMETVQPEYTNIPESTKLPASETTDYEEKVPTTTLQPVQEDLQIDKKDNTPPKTNIKNKTYTKDIKISVTDESQIASIVLQGSINKTIKNGYKLTQEGSYQLILADIYGNTKTVKFELKKTVKKIKISYSFTNEWDELKFSAKVTGTKRSVKWSVSDKKIATVNKNGNFKAKKSGTVYVVAKLDKKKVKQKIKIEKKKKSILLY